MMTIMTINDHANNMEKHTTATVFCVDYCNECGDYSDEDKNTKRASSYKAANLQAAAHVVVACEAFADIPSHDHISSSSRSHTLPINILVENRDHHVEACMHAAHAVCEASADIPSYDHISCPSRSYILGEKHPRQKSSWLKIMIVTKITCNPACMQPMWCVRRLLTSARLRSHTVTAFPSVLHCAAQCHTSPFAIALHWAFPPVLHCIAVYTVTRLLSYCIKLFPQCCRLQCIVLQL